MTSINQEPPAVPAGVGLAGELPEGWGLAELRDIAVVKGGITKGQKRRPHELLRLVPYLRVANVQRGYLDLAEMKEIEATEDEIRELQLLPGDILLIEGGNREHLGRGWIWEGQIDECIHQNHVFRARLINAQMEPRYFSWYANHVGQEFFFAEASQTVNLASINLTKLASLPVAVPPIAEQTRIAQKVEALLVQADTARQRLERVTGILKRFRQSVLMAACSGRLTASWRVGRHVEPATDLVLRIVESHNAAGHGHGGKAADPTEDVHDLPADDLPDHWSVTQLMWICEPGRPITYGILKPGPDQDDGVPYVRVADFPNDVINLPSVRRTTHDIADQYRRSSLRTGDVLLSIRGTVGRVCQVLRELDGGNITQDSARITVHPWVSSDYAMLALRSPAVQKRMKRAVKGVAIRGINIGDVRVLQVPIPPLEEQHEIVRRVNALSKVADAIEARVLAATARAEKLAQAVLDKAFRGELVPTEAELARREGRDYEPASVLLERIRTDRAAAANKPRPRRGRPAPLAKPQQPVARPRQQHSSQRTGPADASARAVRHRNKRS